jgi:hypothetical protein
MHRWVDANRGMPGDITLRDARLSFANARCLVAKRREGLDVRLDFMYVGGDSMPDDMTIAEFRILARAGKAFIRVYAGERSIDTTYEMAH